MEKKNPYTISFGKIPARYLGRNSIIDSIVEAFESDEPDEQAFKLTGIRGTGKTVTLTAIERHFRDRKDWVVVNLAPDSDMIVKLVAELYSCVGFVTEFVDTNLNLSAFGIGTGLSRKSPVASADHALEVLLKELKKKKVRLMVSIDEAHKTPGIIHFIQEFQILIRKELPIYLLAAGLYEDIESLENTDGLTFFWRASKYEMTPLNITYIRDDYMKTLGISFDEAQKAAFLTKGYAYAYQALGKYLWDSDKHILTDDVLRYLDDVLFEKVYKKIWSELAPKDRWFLSFIIKKDNMPVTELLEITKSTHSQWSVPRNRLKEKRIIDVRERGVISLSLPRFKEFVENRILMED
ncbi:MAG: ATP-binding protein [Lachnospiraceae bacterium]|nr:ATP-binding protein [Lachnospiraceae bacterium]